jgi:hypothetical protein
MDTSNTSLSLQAASNSKGMDKLWIKNHTTPMITMLYITRNFLTKKAL